MLEEQVFDVRVHDRASFHCGVSALDDFLHKYAAQQSSKGINTVFVIVDDAAPSKILGFYTLSAAQIDVQQLSDTERKKLPRYPVPCFRMGRLARAIESRGAGLGEILIGCAVDRCLHARSLVGAYALLVDAKDEEAKFFYEQYGFIPCMDAPMTLYLPLGLSLTNQ
ncbi:N-acetyltransferase [Rhodoferax lacus]|uniref:N-acetyltransferase n=1 Tax=Rhodoferax lacus TaxID=2184758 RepID=A0A3E1REI7_9BURK|nr:N-acetyltransferase [Rhodoferax lacus]RFO97774.1 N-acetyltransferase [Rhodoferax lacus]